jgi:predicted dehydrogenase
MRPNGDTTTEDLFLVAGVGSVGSRHLSNLQALGQKNLLLYRTGKGSTGLDLPRGDFQVASNLEDALSRRPAAVIVSNPTALHVETALSAARAGAHLLIEKPLSSSMDGVEELAFEVAERGLAALVAYQFRFHPGLRAVKGWLEEGRIGQVVSAHVFWGEYLPGWHPWEDYRFSYSALPELGGGVIHTLSHPIDYLGWLLGPVESVSAQTGRLSGLAVWVEDAAMLTLRHQGGTLASIYLDYARRPPRHDLEIVGSEGTIRWDNADGVARLFHAESEQWMKAGPPEGFQRNSLFLGEIEHFLACIAGRESPACSLDDGIQALRVALAAHRSAEEGRRIHV